MAKHGGGGGGGAPPSSNAAAMLSLMGHAGRMGGDYEGGGGEGGGGGGGAGGGEHLEFGEANYLMGLLDFSAQSTFMRIMTMGLSTICAAAPYILGGNLESIGHAFLSMLPPTNTPPVALPKPVLFSRRGH